MCRFAPIAVLLALAAPAHAQSGNPLIGDWVIVQAVPAPWAAEARHDALAAQGKRRVDTAVSFTAREVASKDRALACKRALYEPTEVPADAIFQGNLPEPNPTAAARRLGFAKGDVRTVDMRCTRGLFSYYFLDRDTALTALDNVIYTLKRK
jgi:hypothetical protein